MNGRRLLVFTSLLLAFCIAAPGVAAAKRGGTDRPAKGSGSGTTTADLGALSATSEGTARFSHLGKSTYTLQTTFAFPGPNAVTVSGTGTLVAANGDEVFTTFTGTGTFTEIAVGGTAQYTLVFTITGGTGRFADASGTVTFSVSQEGVSLVGTTFGLRDSFTGRGTISY